MAAAWPHGIVKNIYECTCCGGQTEDEHKIRRNQKGAGKLAHPLLALGSGVFMTPNNSDASFSVCLVYAIDVNNAAPSTHHPFSFPVKGAKLKEKAGFAEI